MSETRLAHSLEQKPRSRDVILEENVSFESLFLSEVILKGLIDNGFQKPSPIQVKALPIGRCGFDLIVQAKSGTGKTLVFSIIALETVKLHINEPQVLILSPTREIAVQIQDVIKNIGKHFQGLEVKSFIGGLPVELDKINCKLCHIAVGTPGRIKQLIQDKFLNINSVKLFVLDEADKLLESSFENDVNEIYNALPDKKQILMCSATYSNELKHFLTGYMLSPTHVNVELETPLLLGLKHFVRILKFQPNIVQQTKAKNEELLGILRKNSFTQCLIFSNYQTRAESISNFLNRNGWNSTFISSAQRQTERLNSLSSLKDFKCRILVSTDLTARGIDAANVDLVLNYDIPIDAMTYLHRMGRAGRFGSQGNCVNMAFSGEETKILQNILGIIGGQNISIPILEDSLNIDSSNYEVLGGIIPNNIKEFTDKCKSEVIEMKKKTLRPKKKNHDRKTTALSLEITQDIDEVKKIKEKLVDTDVSDILHQLASGSFEMNDLTKEEPSIKKCNESVISKPALDIIQDNDEVKLIQEKLANKDVSEILQQLVAGTFEKNTSEKEGPSRDILNNISNQLFTSPISNDYVHSDSDRTKKSLDKFDTLSVLQQLANQTFPGINTSHNEERKRKRSTDSASSPTQESLRKEQEVFCKNKALFGIAKSLGNLDTDKDDAEYLAQYLTMLKAKEDEQTDRIFKEKPDEQQKLELEDIFLVAYKSQVDKSSPFWQDLIPTDEKWKLEEIQNDFEDDEDYDEEYDEDYDFEMEKQIDINYGSDLQTQQPSQDIDDYSFMKWIPVEQNPTECKSNDLAPKISTTESSVSTMSNLDTNTDTAHYHNEYGKYFEHVSNNLWQTGLQFENVAQFDQWFWYEWQSQVSTVRDFIRQKIYLEEMNKFQERNKRKK